MFGSHGSEFVRHIGTLLFVLFCFVLFVFLFCFVLFCFCVFLVIWGVAHLEIFPFFSKTAPRSSDHSTDFFFFIVFDVCILSEVFEFCYFFIFSDQLVYVHCLHGLSCILSFLCVCFRPNFRLSEFRLFQCFPLVLVCFGFFFFFCEKSNIISKPHCHIELVVERSG